MGPTGLQQSWPEIDGGSSMLATPPKKQQGEQRGKLKGKGKQKQQPAQLAVPVEDPQRFVRLLVYGLHTALTQTGPCEAQSVMHHPHLNRSELQSGSESSMIAHKDITCHARWP